MVTEQPIRLIVSEKIFYEPIRLCRGIGKLEKKLVYTAGNDEKDPPNVPFYISLYL